MGTAGFNIRFCITPLCPVYRGHMIWYLVSIRFEIRKWPVTNTVLDDFGGLI